METRLKHCTLIIFVGFILAAPAMAQPVVVTTPTAPPMVCFDTGGGVVVCQ